MVNRIHSRNFSSRQGHPALRLATFSVLSVLAVLSGCKKVAPTDPLSGFYPAITILSPKTNDTLFIGLQDVRYSVPDPAGVVFYELYVNDTLKGSFHTNPDGSAPVISWRVDSTLEGSYAWYYLKAYDYDRNTVTSPVMTNLLVSEHPLPPPAPKNLVLWKLSPSSVALTWESGGHGAKTTEVWRKSASEPYAVILSLPGNVVNANDSGLVAGQIYWYKVRAVNQFGMAESKEVTTASDTNGLLPPTDLVATPLGTKLVSLRWTDNATSELGYVIEREQTGSGAYAVMGMVAPNQTTFMDSIGLQAGGQYSYRVAARGPLGFSAWSNEQTVTTLFQDIYPPSDLTAIYDLSTGTVLLAWKDNSVLTIQAWIERKDSTADFVNLARVGIGTTTFSDSAITHGHTYTYRVRVFTAQGLFSNFSNEATASVPFDGPNRNVTASGVPDVDSQRSPHSRKSP